MEELGSNECHKPYVRPETCKPTAFTSVSPAASCVLVLKRGERSAHGTDNFSYLHPNGMQQSHKDKCPVALMNTEL